MRSLAKLRDAEMQGRRPPGRLWLLGGGLGAILGVIVLVPLPDWVSLPASIEAIGATQVSAATEGLLVGPIFMGMSLPLHVLTPAATARGIVNMTALAAVQSRG
jgi:hypothetical protein